MRSRIFYKMIHPGDPDVACQAMDLGFDYSGEAVTFKTLELIQLHMQKNMWVIVNLLQGQDDLKQGRITCTVH